MACIGYYWATKVSLRRFPFLDSQEFLSDSGVDWQQMAGGMPNMNVATPGVPQDFSKLFKQEKENLDFDAGFYKWVGEDVEDQVLRKYGKLPPVVS
jgi:hypothetical protein